MPRFCNVEITNMSESINHNGIIEKIDGGTVYVRIIQQSACSGCHAKSMCTASESKEKIIEVPDNSGKFHINEEVQLCGQSSLGLQAVLLALCISAHHSFCGYCNRYKYAMGRNHKRVNRITALSSLLLHIILFTRQTEKAIHIYFEKT